MVLILVLVVWSGRPRAVRAEVRSVSAARLPDRFGLTRTFAQSAENKQNMSQLHPLGLTTLVDLPGVRNDRTATKRD